MEPKLKIDKFVPSSFLHIKNKEEILKEILKLSTDLTEKELITKSLVQEIHQNIEVKLDRVIYKLLMYQTPKGTTKGDIEEVKNELWEEIGKMGFEQKHRLLKPILKKWSQARSEVAEIMKINDIRRQCTHMRDKGKIQYKGYVMFSDPEGIAMLYIDSWAIGRGLDDLWHWIDDQHCIIKDRIKDINIK